MKTPVFYRQGDIGFLKVPKPRGRRVPRPDGVLAEGEVTGHLHEVEDMAKAEVYEVDGQLMVSTQTGVRIVHQEHDPVVLEPGTYKVIRQREATQMGRPRNVLD